MTVRAKVCCESKDDVAVVFHTVYETEKNDENDRFTRATPWGTIRLGIDNPIARDQFTVGGYYYVDFTPAG